MWLEKDALSGVVFPVTGELDVPLMVTRGYPSISFLHGAAETIARQGKPSYLYYFGDHDPSGVDITRSVDDGIREFAPDADVVVERIAVTRGSNQGCGTYRADRRRRRTPGPRIGTVAPSSSTPSRAKQLRDLVRACIEPHVDRTAWQATERAERADRRRLASLIGE